MRDDERRGCGPGKARTSPTGSRTSPPQPSTRSPGTVLDGEAVIWSGTRLDFDLLQRRLVNTPRKVASLAAMHPASLMVFDVLAHHGDDLRRQPLHQRRALLEELAKSWTPPLQLSPATTDEATARRWFTDYRPAGIEGLVVKGGRLHLHPGSADVDQGQEPRDHRGDHRRGDRQPRAARDHRRRSRPRGELQIVGRTTPLSRTQAAELAGLLTPAGPDHPWPDEVSSSRFGASKDKVPTRQGRTSRGR